MFSSKYAFNFDPVAEKKLGSSIITKNLEEMFQERRSTLLIVPAISRQILTLAQHLDGCCIAGGAALGLYTGDVNKIKDWDLFFADYEPYEVAQKELERLDFEFKDTTDWSCTYEKAGVVVQLVRWRFFNSIKEIFRNFDFSVCCFAIDGPNIKYTEQAAEDVAEGRMNLIHTDNLISCIKRIARYGQKGFKPTSEFAKELIKMSYNTDLEDITDSNGCS